MVKYEVIIDTDIGDDIDDIFALTYCLCNPLFDIKLIIVSSGDNDYKAKLVAYMLNKLNRIDIPIAKSINKPWGCNAQEASIKDFDLFSYQGLIYNDYEEALFNLLSNGKYNFFEFGPSNVLSDFLHKYPNLKSNIDLYYMGGSVYRGYLNHPAKCAEYNVLMSVNATNHLFNLGMNITLLPVDSCYDLIVDNDEYKRLIKSNSNAAKLLLEQYLIWHTDYVGGSIKFDPDKSSTILYDLVVPMYFLYPSFFEEKLINLEINEFGESRIIPGENIKVVTKAIKKEEIIKDFISIIEG